jgi:lipopolysaccharide/colanic/teichoic acid biosynthesis glycosyltransferase
MRPQYIDATGAPPRGLQSVVSPSPWCSSRGKRTIDVALVVISLPVTIPICAILAGVSALRFRCSPVFRQVRRGIDEQPFSVFKIRSLPASFPDRLGKHELAEQQFGRWSRFLRQSHLDELPQILNVLGGSMSLVGPRPMIDAVVERLETHDRDARAAVRPGLTGLWQISTAGIEALHDCPDLDNHYVANATAKTDLQIMLFTLQSVVGFRLFTPVALLDHLGW